MKASIIYIFIAAIFASCSSTDSGKAEYGLDSTDYAVISYAIQQNMGVSPYLENLNFENENLPVTFIPDSTINFNPDELSPNVINTHEQMLRQQGQIDTIDSQWSKKIIPENVKKYKIDNSRIFTVPTRSISNNEFKELYDDISLLDYDKLYKKYPYSVGILRITRPAYDNKRVRAIIYIEFYKNKKSSRGAILWLKKDRDRWIVYDQGSYWVS
ncbi:MAG: hypothetical protein EHM58_10445 [Ignavibacteriae bacterium]|nr:MAG: hypothetical protein EHM58_10445 [Ignavibacteriota bacterium]